MKAKQYIDRIRKKIEARHRNYEKSSEMKSYLYTALGVFGCTFGIIALTYSLPLALAGLGTMISGISGHINNEKRKKINESVFNKEMSHLDQIEKEPIDVSEQTTKKKEANYKKMKDKIMPKYERVEKCKKIETVTNICGIGACVAGIMFGGLVAGLPLLVAGYKFLSDRATTKDYEDYMNDRVELDNLTSEINIARNIKNNTQKSTSTNQVNTKSNIKSSKNNNKSNNYSRQQIIAVDEIVNSIAKPSNGESKNKTMVKR